MWHISSSVEHHVTFCGTNVTLYGTTCTSRGTFVTSCDSIVTETGTFVPQGGIFVTDIGTVVPRGGAFVTKGAHSPHNATHVVAHFRQKSVFFRAITGHAHAYCMIC